LVPPPCSPAFPYTTLFRSEEAGRDCAAGDRAGLLRLLRLGGQRHRVAAGPPLLGTRGQAAEEPHHLAQERLSRLDRRRHLARRQDRKSTRLNSSHVKISYA